MNKLTDDELKKFDTMTDAYNKLVECKTMIKQSSAQVKQDFRSQDDIERGLYFSNPININYDLEKIVENVQSNITEFILRYMDQKYSNLVIDERDVNTFIKAGQDCQKLGIDQTKPKRPVLQGKYTAQAVIQYIEYKYADEETITLQQIKEFASNALPRLDGYSIEKVSKPEHIIVINKTGIELNDVAYYKTHKEDPTAAVIKLIHIKLNHVLPSQAEHHNIDYGDTYSDDKIKSLHRYKNGKLKIVFNNEEDMNTMRRTLLGCDE